MYYPYFRGKQYELITIRENAQLFRDAGFTPIIEPVKESLGGLTKALSAIVDAGGEAIVIINPYHGDHSDNLEVISTFIEDSFKDNLNISNGILLSTDISVDDAHELCSKFASRPITLIHAGFKEAKLLSEKLGERVSEIRHVFLEDNCGKLYQKHFKKGTRILLRDGFEKRINRKHPDIEFFSDLHATFEDEGMQGFGDFLMVGDFYAETGGPAYAIAIHLTFIDPNKDNEMHIHHFKSIRQDDPKDPAGKFAEALDKMIKELESSDTNILKTAAVKEFEDLHARGHFPGLGYVKKLSMKHHIEILADYFKNI